jgi:hypothetical protein
MRTMGIVKLWTQKSQQHKQVNGKYKVQNSQAWSSWVVCVCVCVYVRVITGVWTQGFVLARQALHCLSHSPSPFCIGYFQHRSLELQVVILLISASWVAGIISSEPLAPSGHKVFKSSTPKHCASYLGDVRREWKEIIDFQTYLSILGLLSDDVIALWLIIAFVLFWFLILRTESRALHILGIHSLCHWATSTDQWY